MLPASLSAGPNFVAAALRLAGSRPHSSSRPLSDVDRSATSAPVSKNTIDAAIRGAEFADPVARAARPTLAHRSP